MERNIQTNDSQINFRRAFIGFVSLLGSSVISALGFIIIASNRWIVFDSATAVFIILFVQWQTLGITIAKMGIEQVVFAMVSKNEGAYLDPARYIYKKAVPLAGIFSVVVFFVFSFWAAFVAFATILLDAWSLIIMADLNARKTFKITALSNLLNYPLFFIIIFTVNYYGKLSVDLTLAAFLLSSLVRWFWLKRHRFVQPGMQEVFCRANVEMGAQQALNYLLFRADQILLAIVGLKMASLENAGMYVFLAKFQELASGVMLVAGSVIFPKIYIKSPFDHRAILDELKRHTVYVFGYIAVITLSMYCYVNFWKGHPIPFTLALPFLIQTMCIILVNNITYSVLRHGYLRRLLTNLSFSVLVGLLISTAMQFNFSALTLSWIVPVQVLTFVTLSFALKWGETRELYG